MEPGGQWSVVPSHTVEVEDLEFSIIGLVLQLPARLVGFGCDGQVDELTRSKIFQEFVDEFHQPDPLD
jgi:hypothetical protein